MTDSERPAEGAPVSRGSGASALPAWAAWPVKALLALAGLAAAAVLSVLILAGIALAVAYPNLPEISGLTDYRPKVPLRTNCCNRSLLSFGTPPSATSYIAPG